MALFEEIAKLDRTIATRLIFTIYVNSHQQGMSIWLVSGLPLSDIPWAMLFYLNMKYQFNHHTHKSIILSRLEIENKSALITMPIFLPENGAPSSDDLLYFVKMTRCDVVSMFQVYHTKPTISFMSHACLAMDEVDDRFRHMAPLWRDDVEALTIIAAHPTFYFEPELLSCAALCGAIKCFKFLTINGTKFHPRLLSYACSGGNEEIIQLCLEILCVPNKTVLMSAISFSRHHIVDWIISVHNVVPTTDHLTCALHHGNYVFLVKYVHMKRG